MYLEYFGLKELPFSIAPNPRYLYMSERHREALAHLLYGVSGQGGFVVLTGEVGTGKTTICRCFLGQVPKNSDVAFVVNPKLSARELLATVCDELGIAYPVGGSVKIFNDLINQYLLNAHAQNRHTVLIIDEAQNLRIDVLEQLRLLTNLETSEKKLLQIILLGQPELRDILTREDLRQLAQRITARYHLLALSKEETEAYIRYRLSVAGQKRLLFSQRAVNKIYRASRGVPRLINLICDRSLLGAYASNMEQVGPTQVKQAVKEIGLRHSEIRYLFPDWVFSGFSLGVFLSILIIATLLLGQVWKNKYAIKTKERVQISLPSLTAPSKVITTFTKKEKLKVGQPAYVAMKSLLADNTLENSKILAYQALFDVWKLNIPKTSTGLQCQKIERAGMRCLHKQGNWRSVMNINRPVVLHLRNSKGIRFDVTLLHLKGNLAQISLNGKIHWLIRRDLDQFWLGGYSLIWKVPDYLSAIIRPGMVTNKNKWLKNHLIKAAALLKVSSFTINNIKLNSLKLSIMDFQKTQGLMDDGVAGAMTLIKLNSLLEPSVPHLLEQ